MNGILITIRDIPIGLMAKIPLVIVAFLFKEMASGIIPCVFRFINGFSSIITFAKYYNLKKLDYPKYTTVKYYFFVCTSNYIIRIILFSNKNKNHDDS